MELLIYNEKKGVPNILSKIGVQLYMYHCFFKFLAVTL